MCYAIEDTTNQSGVSDHLYTISNSQRCVEHHHCTEAIFVISGRKRTVIVGEVMVDPVLRGGILVRKGMRPLPDELRNSLQLAGTAL